MAAHAEPYLAHRSQIAVWIDRVAISAQPVVLEAREGHRHIKEASVPLELRGKRCGVHTAHRSREFGSALDERRVVIDCDERNRRTHLSVSCRMAALVLSTVNTLGMAGLVDGRTTRARCKPMRRSG